MGRKFRVDDVVRVTKKARRQTENKDAGFECVRWYGRVIRYTRGMHYPYTVQAARRKGRFFVFTARELDLIARPKKGAK